MQLPLIKQCLNQEAMKSIKINTNFVVIYLFIYFCSKNTNF